MILTTVLNVVLAIGVIVMVVAPLAWAILTQQRDQPRPVTADRPIVQPADPRPSEPRRRARRPAHRPVVGGA